MKEIKQRRPHYSGDLSRGFWKQVNSLPEEQQRVAYALGVVLQDVEHRALQYLANLTLEVRSNRGRPRV